MNTVSFQNNKINIDQIITSQIYCVIKYSIWRFLIKINLLHAAIHQIMF